MKVKLFSRVSLSLLLVALVLSSEEADGLPAKLRARVRIVSLFQVQVDDVNYTCGARRTGRYVPGSVDKKGRFTPTSSLVTGYKKQLKTAVGRRAKRLRRALRSARKYLAEGTRVCKAGPPAIDPTPTATTNPDATPRPSTPTAAPTEVPTIALTPTPTPTPTPSIPGGTSCDSQRRTTGFGIPGGLIGYGQQGALLWSANCAGCHGSNGKRGKSYTAVYSSRLIGAMSSVNSMLSNAQNTADITADRNCP